MDSRERLRYCCFSFIVTVILLIPLVIYCTHKSSQYKQSTREQTSIENMTPERLVFQVLTQEDDTYVVTDVVKEGKKVTFLEARNVGKSSNHSELNESEASPGEFPYHAAIIEGDEYVCSGSLISKKHVLTAAQCVVGIKQKIKIRLGHNLKRGLVYDVDGVSVHRDYRESDHRADVAIIRLKKSVVTSNFVKPVALPEAGQPSGFSIFYTTGYGVEVNAESVLRKMPLWLVPNSECKYIYRDNIELQIANDTICTSRFSSYDSCEGDIGSALVDGRKNVLRGIGSYGDEFCRSPDIFTNVTYYLDYIRNEISSDEFSTHHPWIKFTESFGMQTFDRHDQVEDENDDNSWSSMWVKVLTTIFGGMR